MPVRTHQDALVHGRVRGRGAGLNPGNRFQRGRSGDGIRLHVLGDHLDERRAAHPAGVQVPTEVSVDDSRRILNRVDSPDLPFRWSMNPYRGCEHGCVYCYARPSHETLGFSCGLDFETRIVAKPEAPELLRRDLASPGWRGEPIAMSGITDPYQPTERTMRITRVCLEVMAACRQPVGIVTKSRLVTRDRDVLADLARHRAAAVAISLTTLDPELARRLEPRASSPRDRLRAITELTAAGIPVTVLVAPIIPGLTDHELPRLLQAAAGAGATRAGWVLLRLPYQVKEVFLDWLRRELPLRAKRVEQAIRATRNGALSDPRFGSRQRGEGVHAEHLARTFALFARRFRLAFRAPGWMLSSASFRRPEPGPGEQLELSFDA